MKLIKITLAVFFIGLLTPVHAQLVSKWTQTYNGQGADVVVDVATDASGNVYVVGHTFDGDYDIITTKYNVNGVQQWQKTYSSGDDYAVGVGVDGSGNVYVVGQINSGSNSTTGGVTIKYNSAGTQQWASAYTTGSVSHSVTVRDAIFDASGNTFITGKISSTIYGNDIVVVKANPSTGAYTSANYNIDLAQEGFKIAISGSDLFVLGYESANKKLIALRYPTGFSAGVSPTSTSTYTSGSNLEIRALAIRNSDNVLALSSAGSNLLLNKFDLNSSVSGEFGVNRAMDNPTDLTFDASGNIYITGSNFVSLSDRLKLIKYNSAGTFQAESTLQPATGSSEHAAFSSEGRSIFLDSNNDIIIGGELVYDDPTNGNNNVSVYVGAVKFNTSGVQQAVYPYTTTSDVSQIEKAILGLSNSVILVGGGTTSMKTWFMCRPPTVNLGSDITQAYNPSSPNITLDAGAGHSSYLWNTGATTRTIAVNTTGTYSVTVGNSIGCEASDVIGVNITPINQTITFALPFTPFAKTLITDAGSFSVSASSTSGLHPTFSSLNTSVATVNNNGNGTATINIVGAGEAVIRASQGGNQYYNLATNVDRTLTVHKAVQSVDFPPVSAKLITLNSFEIVRSTITGASGAEANQLVSSNTSLATVDNYSNWQVNMIAAGEVTLTATVPGNATYQEGQAQRIFNINKAPQQITFSLGSEDTQIMGVADIFLNGTSDSGLPVTYTSTNTDVATVYQFEGSWKVHLEGAGTTTITALQPGNEYYSAATPVGDVLTVGKGSQGIDFQLQSTAAIGDEVILSATTNAGLTVAFESSDEAIGTISGNVLTLLSGGTVTITASQPGTDDWEAALPVEKLLGVTDPVAPAFVNSSPVVSASTAQSITLEVALDKQGLVYVVALSDGSPSPNAAEVKNGTGSGGSTPIRAISAVIHSPNAAEFIAINSLVNGTQYDIYIVAQNNDNVLQASPTKIDATAQDLDNPIFEQGYPTIENISDEGFELIVSLNEASVVYYAVGLQNASTPSPVQVKNGNLSNDQPALYDGQIGVTAVSEEFSDQVVSLSENTTYKVFCVAEDFYGNLQDEVGSLSVTTLDVTPPSFTGGTPNVVSLTETTAEVAVKLNESGTVHYVLVANNAAAPSVEEVKNGQSAGGGSPLASGEIENVDNAGDLIELSFSETNELDLFLVATDQAAAPNTQDQVTKVNLEDFDPSPSFTSGYPATDLIEANYFRLKASLSQAGSVYYVVVGNNAGPPSALEVKNGQAAGGATALKAGELQIAVSTTEYMVIVVGLSPETSYDVYLVAENANEDLQASPTKIDVETIFKVDTYFWVGNGGNWSDLSHWATTSGGAVKHLTLPDMFDNVIFDANSFSIAGQQVTVDADELTCNDIDWSGVVNSPTLYSTFGQELHVFGSVNWGANVVLSLNEVHLKGTGNHNIAGEQNWGGISDLFFEGAGRYTLMNDVTLRQLIADAGELVFSNVIVDAATIIIRGSVESNPVVTLGSSEITVSEKFGVWSGGNFEAGTSTIHFDGAILESGGAEFNELVFSGVSSVDGSSEVASISIEAGAQLTLRSGETITTQTLEAEGSNSQFIELRSSLTGQQATISKASGNVTVEYVRMKDIAATGGASFLANNSVDLGNNSGWQIEAPANASYYWVGGSGSWSNLNHWATSSGGSAFHTELPGLLNDVFFDSQSFSNSGQTVTLDINSSVRAMDWTGALSGSAFHSVGKHCMVYGGLVLSSTTDYNIGTFTFKASDADVELEINGNSLGESSKLVFDGSGSWNVAHDMNVEEMEFKSGSVSFLGDNYTIQSRIDLSADTPFEVDFGNASYTLGDYFDILNPQNVTLSAENSIFNVSGANFYGGGKVFGKVVFHEDVLLKGSNTFETLEIKEGVSLKVLESSIQNISELSANGSIESPIYFLSQQEGNAFTFNKTDGEVNISYVILRDNEATGGAVFNAENSYSEGNVSGWNISEPDRTSQQVTVDAISDKVFGEASFLALASSDSGLPVTFEAVSTNINVSRIGFVDIIGAGEATIRAVQAGSLVYFAAQAEVSFTVSKAGQTISFDDIPDKLATDPPFALIASGGGSGNPVIFTVVNGPATIVSNELTISGSGSITVRASQVGNANYEAAAPIEQTFVVKDDEETKADQTIAFETLPVKTYGETPFDLAATGGASGNAVTYASSNTGVATISGNTVTITGAGETTITASQAGNANYMAAADVAQTLTVNKASQTITFEEIADQVLSTGSITLEATAGSGLAVSYEASGPATLNGAIVTFTGAGEVTVIASQEGNSNYNAAQVASRTFTITDNEDTRTSQTITLTLPESVYEDEGPLQLTATSTSGLAVSFAVTEGPATIDGSTLTITGAGTVEVVGSQAGNETFKAAESVVATLIVRPLLTISGTVTGSTGEGISGKVLLLKETGGVAAESQLINGQYTISGQKDGSYYLRAIPTELSAIGYYLTYYAGAVQWNEGTLVTLSAESLINIDWQAIAKPNNTPSGKGIIRGRVVSDNGTDRIIMGRSYDGGTPLEGITVYLLKASDNSVFAEATTDAEGGFAMTGLPGGSYRLHVDVPGVTMDAASSAIQLDENTPIELTAIVGENKIVSEITIIKGIEDGKLTHIVAYPNPASEQLIVELNDGNNDQDMKTLRLFDLQGRELRAASFTGTKYLLNLQQLGPGIYLLTAESSGGLVLGEMKVKKE